MSNLIGAVVTGDGDADSDLLPLLLSLRRCSGALVASAALVSLFMFAGWRRRSLLFSESRKQRNIILENSDLFPTNNPMFRSFSTNCPKNLTFPNFSWLDFPSFSQCP
jgi:hypothetical protein